MSTNQSLNKTANKIVSNPNKSKAWWNSLETQWQKAFNQAMLNNGDTSKAPTHEQIVDLWTHPNYRFVGPTGPYANMNFELTNLSGLRGMTHLNILVVSFHKVVDIENIKSNTKLKSLFLHSNKIKNIKAIQGLLQLEDLHLQNNCIETIYPINGLKHLKSLNIKSNEIQTLKGISEKHAKTLKQFCVLPNDNLLQSEIIHCENKLGIRCLRA